jgi:hypothetical protein
MAVLAGRGIIKHAGEAMCRLGLDDEYLRSSGCAIAVERTILGKEIFDILTATGNGFGKRCSVDQRGPISQAGSNAGFALAGDEPQAAAMHWGADAFDKIETVRLDKAAEPIFGEIAQTLVIDDIKLRFFGEDVAMAHFDDEQSARTQQGVRCRRRAFDIVDMCEHIRAGRQIELADFVMGLGKFGCQKTGRNVQPLASAATLPYASIPV